MGAKSLMPPPSSCHPGVLGGAVEHPHGPGSCPLGAPCRREQAHGVKMSFLAQPRHFVKVTVTVQSRFLNFIIISCAGTWSPIINPDAWNGPDIQLWQLETPNPFLPAASFSRGSLGCGPRDVLGWGVCCPQHRAVPSCPQPVPLPLERSPAGLCCW